MCFSSIVLELVNAAQAGTSPLISPSPITPWPSPGSPPLHTFLFMLPSLGYHHLLLGLLQHISLLADGLTLF